MNKLFEWCTSLSEKMSDGAYANFYNDYFSTSVLSTVFFWGIGIALIIALVYYLGVCNFSFKLAKRWSWLVVLLLTGIVCLFVSNSVMIGTYDGDPEDSTGFFASIDSTREGLLALTTTEDEVNQVNLDSGSLRDSVLEGNETIFAEISLMNALYSIIFFVLFSILFKRFSTHGKAIPW